MNYVIHFTDDGDLWLDIVPDHLLEAAFDPANEEGYRPETVFAPSEPNGDKVIDLKENLGCNGFLVIRGRALGRWELRSGAPENGKGAE